MADGTTVLLTTQYLEEADRLADYLAVVDHGQIIAKGTPAGLKAGLGSTVIEIGMPGEGSALMALQALAPLGVAAPDPRRHDREAHRGRRRERPPRGPPGARRRGDRPHRRDPAGAEPRRRLPVPDRSRHRGQRAPHDLRPTHLEPPAAREQKAGSTRLRDRPRRRRPGAAPKRDAPRRPQGAASTGWRLRHRRRDPAQPHRLHPDPGGAGVLLDPADHVRAAVPLRLRRGDARSPASATSTTSCRGSSSRPCASEPSPPGSAWPRISARA